jgi:branched-subunit amino acid transport protein
MTTVWAAVAIVSLICILLRAAGPMVVRKALPRRLDRWLQLLAPALLAGFVAVQTLATGHSLTVDARLAGVTMAGLAIMARRSPVVVLLAAAATTAAVRAFW